MSRLHIVVIGVYIPGSSRSFGETLSYKRCARKSWRSLRMLKASETSPQNVFCCQTLGSGLLMQPAVSPPTPFQLFLSSDILRLPSRDVTSSSSSWKSWQHSVVLCLSWQMYLCPSQAERGWMMLNLHKNSKKWYWFFLDFLLFIYFWRESYSKFQSQTSNFKYFFCTSFWDVHCDGFYWWWVIFIHSFTLYKDSLYNR